MERPIDANALFDFLTDQLDKETGAYSKGRNAGIDIARSALHDEIITPTITQPSNAPLTISELRELRKDWVWIQTLTPLYGMDSGYYIKHPAFSSEDDFCCGYPGTVVRHLTYAGYGDYWLAYRRKPEEVHP